MLIEGTISFFAGLFFRLNIKLVKLVVNISDLCLEQVP